VFQLYGPSTTLHLPFIVWRVKNWVAGRVTRLGKFSPNGWLLSLGNYFENCRKSSHFWAIFETVRLFNFDKKCLGLHFGRFYHKLIWSPWWRVLRLVGAYIVIRCSVINSDNSVKSFQTAHQKIYLKAAPFQRQFFCYKKRPSFYGFWCEIRELVA
jgi:hypothetical protein